MISTSANVDRYYWMRYAYRHRQIFRTETEARVSVLDDIHFPTKASKYWQSIREQTTMLEQLAMLSFDYRRNEVKIKRSRKMIEAATNEFDREEAQIDLDEALFNRENMKTVAEDRARELGMWSKIKAELADGSFDQDNVDAHQLVSYTARFAMMAASADQAQMTSGEYTNLFGQLQTSLQRCMELKVMDKLFMVLPDSVKAKLQLT
jgi:hypothetical protein